MAFKSEMQKKTKDPAKAYLVKVSLKASPHRLTSNFKNALKTKGMPQQTGRAPCIEKKLQEKKTGKPLFYHKLPENKDFPGFCPGVLFSEPCIYAAGNHKPNRLPRPLQNEGICLAQKNKQFKHEPNSKHQKHTKNKNTHKSKTPRTPRTCCPQKHHLSL